MKVRKGKEERKKETSKQGGMTQNTRHMVLENGARSSQSVAGLVFYIVCCCKVGQEKTSRYGTIQWRIKSVRLEDVKNTSYLHLLLR